MATEHATVTFTYEDYLLIPEDDKRHEIIDGEEYVSPAPTPVHQRIVGRLFIQLSAALKESQGELFIAPFDVILSETDVVQPDVLYISPKRLSMLDEERGLMGAPDLVVEVLSEGNRRHDEMRKRKLYAKYDVQEYWVVDPELDAVKVYRMTDAGFERAAELTLEAGDTLDTPLLPDFTYSLSKLFT